MPILYYVIANLLVGFCASFYRETFARGAPPYSRRGRLLLALFPAVGFGYVRYERWYALGIKPNPLLRCFVWRSVRRFNWWFIAMGTVPITIWVVRLLTDDWSVSFFEGVGQFILGVVLVLPVALTLIIVAIGLPTICLSLTRRKHRIGINSMGAPVFL